MKFKALIMDEAQMRRAIIRMSHEVIERNRGAESVVLVGMQKRGVPLAEEMADIIQAVEGKHIPVGSIDISSYRDASPLQFVQPLIKQTDFPFSIQDANIILVDDVLSTGRKTRAAVEALVGAGFPKTVQLAVLIDRGNHDLPVSANYTGKVLSLSPDELVSVNIAKIDGKSCVEVYSISDH